MGIKLSLSDQIKLLRDTAENIGERVKYLAQVDFDECLLEYQTITMSMGSIASRLCNLLLESTDDELDILRQEADCRSHARTIPQEPVFDGRRIWE